MPMSRTCPRKGIAEDRIAVAQQVARQLVEGEGLAQLLSGPLRGRVPGHVAVENAPTVMGQNQKDVKHLETEGGHGEEVDGDQLGAVIVQEGPPGLRGRPATAYDVFADAAFAEVETEFEQLAVDAGCTPTGILPAHLADQVSNLAGDPRPSGLAAPHLPGPEPAEAGTMPCHDRFGLYDDQGRTPVAPEAGQPHPQPAV